MGLGIHFIFADGSTYSISMCYGSFSNIVMHQSEMREYFNCVQLNVKPHVNFELEESEVTVLLNAFEEICH